MKKLDKAVKMLSNKKIRSKIIKSFEEGRYQHKYTGRINPIQECAIAFYFLQYIKFIDYCGGRVFYKMIEEYANKHLGDKEHTVRQNIYDMEAYGLVKQSDKKVFNNSLISLSQPSIDFLNNRKSLNKINLVNLYRSTYKANLLTNQSKEQKRRTSIYLNNNSIADTITNEDYINKLEEKNIFIFDLDEQNNIHLTLFDINETLDFPAFKKILENDLLPLKLPFYINVYTANQDRADVLIKTFIREIKEKGTHIKNPRYKNCGTENINIDDIFKPSGAFSRGKPKKSILKPTEAPQEALSDIKEPLIPEIEIHDFKEDAF